MLDLPPTVTIERCPDDVVVPSEKAHGRLVAESIVHLRGACDIREHDGPERRFVDRYRRVRRVDHPPEEGGDVGVLHPDDLTGNVAMRHGVHARHGLLVGCVHETERRLPGGIEPVREEAGPVLVLDGEILEVGPGDVLGRGMCHVVAVHKRGHAGNLSGTGEVCT